ncbi:hypothetical protein LINPERPRIM_LOCUS33358 [Linum perenne]
MLYH